MLAIEFALDVRHLLSMPYLAITDNIYVSRIPIP